jgi:hypothetical protein
LKNAHLEIEDEIEDWQSLKDCQSLNFRNGRLAVLEI